MKFIASFEGFRSYPYRDAVGVWTIGYGHTHGVGPGSRHLTQAQGLALLKSDLANEYERPVRALPVPLNQNQFDALVSFVYNLGPGVLASGSTMGALLRRKNYAGAARAMLQYDHAGGRVLLGLSRRRQAESRLFSSHPLNPAAHKLAVWRAELAKRRDQAKHTRSPGRLKYLARRVGELVKAIRKNR